jgi:WhiB family redox-sensing transcriptional regulator
MSNVRRLPGPNADVWDWQMEGLCRGRDSGQFFHPDGERGSARARREMAAKALCRACPVRPECAAQSLSAREPYGVWGGFTEGERLRLLALGWQDAWQRYRRQVDVGELEAKLSRDLAKNHEVTRTFVGAGVKPAPRQATAREKELSVSR